LYPRLVEQPIARKNFPDEWRRVEAIELFCGKLLDRFARRSEKFSGSMGRCRHERRPSRWIRGRSCAGATEQGVNSCEQFADTEGLVT